MASCRVCDGSGQFLGEVCPLCDGDLGFCLEPPLADRQGARASGASTVDHFSVDGEVDYDKLVPVVAKKVAAPVVAPTRDRQWKYIRTLRPAREHTGAVRQPAQRRNPALATATGGMFWQSAEELEKEKEEARYGLRRSGEDRRREEEVEPAQRRNPSIVTGTGGQPAQCRNPAMATATAGQPAQRRNPAVATATGEQPAQPPGGAPGVPGQGTESEQQPAPTRRLWQPRGSANRGVVWRGGRSVVGPRVRESANPRIRAAADPRIREAVNPRRRAALCPEPGVIFSLEEAVCQETQTSNTPVVSDAARHRNAFNITVTTFGGGPIPLNIGRDESVFHLRRRVATVLSKPLTQTVLVYGTEVLHGMQSVADVLVDGADVTLLVSAQGPIEEIIDPDSAEESLAEYFPDIYRKLKGSELKCMVQGSYMSRQTDINANMRAILIDWLVEVHWKFKLKPGSLFLTVSLLDRYLERVKIPRKQLQLVGVACLHIASKFEENQPTMVGDLVYICDNAYTEKEVRLFDAQVLSVLQFDLHNVTAAHFQELYQRANRCDGMHVNLLQYILKLTLLDIQFVSYAPSQLAAAATLLSNQVIGRSEPWSLAMASFTGFDRESLEALKAKVANVLRASSTTQLQALQRIYRRRSFDGVSNMDFTGQGVY